MIIDTHVHIGSMIGWNMTEDMVLESMKKYNIDFSLVSNAESVSYDHSFNKLKEEDQFTQIESLKRSLNFARKYPKKIGVLPWIKPESEGLTKEFKKLVLENLDIIYGMKVHPYHSKTAFDSEKIEPYIRFAEKYDLTVVSHTGGCMEASEEKVYNVAKKFPNVKFVMVHMGLGSNGEKAIEYISKLQNLYGDTTWVPIETTIKAIEAFGSEKIIFGSDNPIDGVDTYSHNPKGNPTVYSKYFGELKDLISKEDYDNIMYKNAIKIFNIK